MTKIIKLCIVYLLSCLVGHRYREKVHNWTMFQHYNFKVFKNKNIKNI